MHKGENAGAFPEFCELEDVDGGGEGLFRIATCGARGLTDSKGSYARRFGLRIDGAGAALLRVRTSS